MNKCTKCGKDTIVGFNGDYYCVECLDEIIEKFKNIIKEDKIETYICKECERKFTNDETYRIGDIDDIYCQECADKLFEICCDCEEYINHNKEEYHLYNGNKICHTCFINYYDQCYHCDEVINEEDYYIINGRIVCQHCLDNRYSKCECCDEYYETDNGYWTYDDHFVCCDCYNNEYFTCEGCDYIFHENNLYSHNDCCYCEDCYNEINANLHDWDYKPCVTFHGEEDRKNNLHIGIELEIQGNGYVEFANQMNETYDEDMFYLKSDGSLEDNGVEIVSQPMTYDFIMNNTDWYKVFRYMENHSMDDIDNAGLHFHLDKEYLTEKDIQMIDYIVNNYSEYFSELGGRSFDECSRYCRKMKKSSDNWGKKTSDDSRYQAVNLTNTNTVELRFCKSTCDFETFINRVKMIFAIANFSKLHDMKDFINIDNGEFEMMFKKFMDEHYFKDNNE